MTLAFAQILNEREQQIYKLNRQRIDAFNIINQCLLSTRFLCAEWKKVFLLDYGKLAFPPKILRGSTKTGESPESRIPSRSE